MSDIQSDIITRLEQSVVEIRNVQELCNVPSISFGVLHQGEIIFRHSIGMRDVERQLPADSSTSYPLGSVSKGFLSAALGIAVDDKKMLFTSKLADFAKDFHPRGDPNLAKAEITDFMRHTSGLGCPQIMLIGPHGVLLSGKDGDKRTIDLLNESPTTDEQGQQRLGASFVYNSLAYGLVGVALQEAYSIRYSDFLRDRILEPLALRHTAIARSDLADNDNVACNYCWLKDNQKFSRLNFELTDERNTPIVATMGMRSSVDDMLRWAAALLSAKSQEDTNANGGFEGGNIINNSENPLRNVSMIQKPQLLIPTQDEIQNQCAYAMGWSPLTLPSSMLNWLSFNVKLLWDEKGRDIVNANILGKESPERLAIIHGGVVNGASCAFYTFPETQSAVVAFSNAVQDGDASDWTASILKQALFDLQPHVDITASVVEERRLRDEEFDIIHKDWLEHRNIIAATKAPTTGYVGKYHGLGMTISIMENPQGGLSVRFNDFSQADRDLDPYDEDVLSFMPLSREAWLEASMIDWDYYETGLLRFSRNVETGQVDGFSWKWDRGEIASHFKRVD
ncbi:beta-lactamase/transpeptidase-like protein [Penicillium angulare]|uniref:Beta-lactamase/transpeptidase-like protein n=1 Tax=Penicillium angulare TaxID=116970 RepID=A0A9W9KQ77_9EURO|nr:beta-lactamase/transpeptidase-like protein [Penicillium angulare]